MKLLIYLIVNFFICNACGQNKVISVMFDSTSNKSSLNQNKARYKIPNYEKIERESGIEFIIKGESFYSENINIKDRDTLYSLRSSKLLRFTEFF